MQDDPSLGVQLLGAFRIVAGDAPLRLDQPRLQRLLVYLLLHRHHPRPRQQVAFTLWPDTNEEQALKNLRTLLTRLRQSLPDLDRYLAASTYALQWRHDAPCHLDVARFEDACAAAVEARQHGQPGAAITAYESATSLYTGDLTPGWYDEWLVPERERLRDRYQGALEELCRLLAEAGRLRDALGHAQQLLRADPLHEAAYRLLMQLHLDLDDRAAALRVYHTCATTLRNVLGADPSPATQTLYLRSLGSDDEAAPPQPSPAAEPATHGAAGLVGRRAEWEALRRAWQTAASGRAQVVLISGEAGIGKTRLAEELLAWVGRQGAAATAVARCYASGGSLAYAPVAEWLRSASLQHSVQQVEGIWRSEVARLLPELLANHPDLPAPGPMTEAWQRQRFFQALNRGVLGTAAEGADGARPLLLLLDDVQWCDRETLDWLHYLIQTNANAPLLVLATVRAEEAQDDHPLAAFRLALERDELLHALTLAPLDAGETAALAADLLGHALPPAQEAQLFASTEGNPLFVVETVRAGGAEWEIGRHGEGERGLRAEDRNTAAVLPPKVRAVIRRRLALLSPGAQALAETAAVLGRAFTFPVLARASGNDEAAVVQGLDELWRRRIVREQGADAYDFSHDKIRAVAYAELSPMRRRAAHLRAAETIRALHPESLDSVSIQIADHYALAGRNEPAVVFYRRAGAAAQRIYANSEAIRLYQLLLSGELASALSPAEACEVRLALGEVWRITGDWTRAEQINLEAMRMAESQGNAIAVAHAQRALADVMRLQGHYDAALKWLTEAEAGFAASQDWRGVVSALWTAGEIYWFKGDHVQALSALERQLRIASQHDDQRGICEALDTLGMVYWSQGDWDQSLECCHRSIAIAEPLGYHLVITRADITIGNVYSSQKGANEAVHWWLQAGLLAQQIDDRQVLTWAIANIAGMAANCGDLLTALIGHEQAILLATEIGDRWTACLNIADLGNVLEQLHREKMAEFLYRQAVALGRALDIPSYLAGMLVDLASLLLRQGRATEATAVHAEAITMLARVEGRRLAGADRRFEADLLGVQLGKASGALTPDDAEQQIRGLLQEYAEPAQRAALHDELWQVAPTNQAARATAADLYRALYAGTAHDRYRQRHFELTAIALPDPPPLPDVSKLIPPRSPDIDGLLERLAPLLAQLEVSFNG